MEHNNNNYWRSIDELNQSPAFVEESSKEFAEDLPIEETLNAENLTLASNRRDFLKIFGFSLGAATLAACNKTPIKKAIPFLDHPEEMSPTIANYYASTYFDGYDYASILVKTREGRPIKIEGNNLSSVNKGAINARVQAAVLGLYDQTRLQNPTIDNKPANWTAFDESAKAALSEAISKGEVALLTASVISPTTQAAIDALLDAYPGMRHVQYDSVSYAGILDANQESFGLRAIPSYRFDNAKVIVGIGADFLGNWISPVEYTHLYTQTRKLNPENPVMSRHFQFESGLSITGSNADFRATYKPTNEGVVVGNLYNAVAALVGQAPINVPKMELAGNLISLAAKELVNAKGSGLLVCGSNSKSVQILVNAINNMIGALNNTLSFDRVANLKKGSDASFNKLISDIENGTVSGLITMLVNPVYDSPNANFASTFNKLAFRLHIGEQASETASASNFVAAAHHFLESWGDAQPYSNIFSIAQPAIAPLFETRQAEATLLALANKDVEIHDLMQQTWKNGPLANNNLGFTASWRQTLHNGVLELASSARQITFSGNIANASADLPKPSTGLDLLLYEKASIGDGRMANNPWLQELPDPITRTCWDNYLAIPKKIADELKVKDGDHLSVSANGHSVEVPALVQPGMNPETVALAIGYGRKVSGVVGTDLGVNAYPFQTVSENRLMFAGDVKITKTGGFTQMAQTQTHHTIEGRDIVKETTLSAYQSDKASGNVRPYVVVKDEHGHSKKVSPTSITLWQEYDYEGHHWAMAVDMNACTGCGACVVACQVENNVPVVGKDEVIRRREMHWIRIDRYYKFQDDAGSAVTKEVEYNKIADYTNVQVVFQPLMCMQCDNAPCETVCPVLATVHSDEGLNQMVYNRCVGTRYCANNCPYKVRRFNWFNYFHNTKFYSNPAQNDLGRMVLNPDVTVRSRGVMEKCTFCVQRIQAGKLEGKRQGKRPADGAIKTACQQTCPANAIVFGDLNDKNSEVYKLFKNERSYAVLEEINVLPSVNYLTKVRNNELNQA